MLELAFAYLTAGALITGLFFMARRNQKQGWRRDRGVWWDVQTAATVTAYEPRQAPPLQHLGDLVCLQQSLAHLDQAASMETVGVRPEPKTALSRSMARTVDQEREYEDSFRATSRT
jgi:hypothetical protein